MDFFEATFRAGVVSRVTGLPVKLITQWIDRGLIKPANRATGSGGRHLFSVENICKIELFKLLNERGYTRSAGAAIIESEIFEYPGILHLCSTLYQDSQDSKEYKTLLTKKSFDPMYLGFYNSGAIVFIGDKNGMAGLYWSLKDWEDIYIVNIAAIIERVYNSISAMGE